MSHNFASKQPQYWFTSTSSFRNFFAKIEVSAYAAINVIPDYPPHGYVGGNIGDCPVLAIDLCPKGGALAHFQSQGNSKKHTNILIIATQKCPMAGALARVNC